MSDQGHVGVCVVCFGLAFPNLTTEETIVSTVFRVTHLGEIGGFCEKHAEAVRAYAEAAYAQQARMGTS